MKSRKTILWTIAGVLILASVLMWGWGSPDKEVESSDMPIVAYECSPCCGGIVVACCDNPLPDTLYMVITGGTPDDPTCLDGTFPLVWNSLTSRWEGSAIVCGGLRDFYYYCVLPDEFWQLDGYLTTSATAVICSPYQSAVTGPVPGGGTFIGLIVETPP